jgi:hypothetical protein
MNPALSIIEKVKQNRPLNDPQQLPSYRYTSYNKFLVTTANDAKKQNEGNDSINQLILDYFQNQYVFLSESVVEGKFRYPAFRKETVLSSRVSGLKDPSFTILTSQLQPFSFYNDEIEILDREYVNPVSDRSNWYDFILFDTLYNELPDTVFLIRYKPAKAKYFQGLSGVLYIHTDRYAIQNVLATTVDTSDNDFTTTIEQQYRQISGAWFPVQLNTQLTFKKVTAGSFPLQLQGKTYLRDIELTDVRKREFDGITIENQAVADEVRDSLLNKFRIDSLTIREKNTYRVIDSLADEVNLVETLRFIESLARGRIRAGFVEINLGDLIFFNEYEGLRLGMGLFTNDKISERFEIGGYGAYGFSDKEWKYGALLHVLLIPKQQVNLEIHYGRDIEENGGVKFYQEQLWASSDVFRRTSLNSFSSVKREEIRIGMRLLKYLNLQATVFQTDKQVIGDYFFIPANSTEPVTDSSRFQMAGVKISGRYAFQEKLFRNRNRFIATERGNPVLFLQYTQNISRFLNGDFSFRRVEGRLNFQLRFGQLGHSDFSITAGIVDAGVPVTDLFAGRGDYAPFSFFSPNALQTMKVNEFVSDRYVTVLFHHNFEWLFYYRPRFHPEPEIHFNYSIGNLDMPELHYNIDYKIPLHPFLEGGLMIRDIFYRQVASVLEIGIGAGAFYRLGYYSFPDWNDNLAVKAALEFHLR